MHPIIMKAYYRHLQKIEFKAQSWILFCFKLYFTLKLNVSIETLFFPST